MRTAIEEVIVVEGMADKDAVLRAVDAFVLTTGGFAADDTRFQLWQPFAKACGLCILTDPDGPGERIRKCITACCPTALQARIEKKQCISKRKRVGIAYASPEAIRNALLDAGCHKRTRIDVLTTDDFFALGLSGNPTAKARRRALAAHLGIPTADSRTMLQQLNVLGLTAEEVRNAISKGATAHELTRHSESDRVSF